jgi:uncharacterized protein YndB with AHSA1/START domain
VKQSAADGFLIALSAPVKADAQTSWTAITQPQRWWSSEHTWSGKASNLSLKAEAGGCYCERWTGGSAEHGRVTMALPNKLLRLDTALGPLQEFALKGVLSFWIKSGDDGATTLEVEYRVNGASGSGLDEFAPKVDEVLGEQFARLVRLLDSGNPEPPPPAPKLPAPDTGAKARAAIIEEWKQSAEAEKAEKEGAKPAAKKPVKPAVSDKP